MLYGIRLDYHCDNNIIEYNTFTNAPGIVLYEDTSTIVRNNNLNNVGIYMMGVRSANISNNYLSGLVADPGASSYTTNTIILKNNTIKGGNYVDFRNLVNSSITNNRFIGVPMTFGISSMATPSYNVSVANNVFYDISGDAIDISENSGETDEIYIKNNIFMNVAGFCVDKNTVQDVYVSHNDIWGCSISPFDGVPDANTIYQDPLFIDVSNTNFHLKSQHGRWNGTTFVNDSVTSPCIDSGDPLSAYSNEPDYPNGQINMGAYGNTSYASKGIPPEPEDTTPPYTSGHNPAKNAIGISKQTNISLHIQDNDSGVDIDSIQLTVNNQQISNQDIQITGTSSDYTLTYNSPTDFDYNQVVDITIDASDLASTPNAMNTETYSFTVQSSPDEDPPTGSILINSGESKTNSQTVNLTISATDDSGLSEMKISETNDFDSATAEPYSTIKSFILSIGDGIKTIYIWFKDAIGNWNTSPYSDSIELDSTGPIISNIQETNITTNSSTITFTTNELSTSYIEYGLTSNYGSQTENSSQLLTFDF